MADQDSHFKPPQRLYTYDYITGPWLRQLVFAGIGDRRTKSFLSEESLVNGSANGGVATRWSKGQELWEGTIHATGIRQLFFSGDSIDELCNILAEQVDQVPKANTKPSKSSSLLSWMNSLTLRDVRPTDKDMSFSASKILEPRSLRAFRPVDVEDLRTTLHSMKSNLFSLILTQSRKAYSDLYSQGGTIFTLKTQRYELDAQIVTEIGWSYTTPGSSQADSRGNEDVIRHRGTSELPFVIRPLAADAQYSRRRKQDVPQWNEDSGSTRCASFLTSIPCGIASDMTCAQFFGFPDPITKEGTKLILESDIQKEIGGVLDKLASSGPVLLVVHGADLELSYFREHLSPGIDKWKAEMPGNLYVKDKDQRYPIVIQDTQRLYAAFKQEPEHASTILHSACTNEGIPSHKVLNAGKLR